MAAGVSPRSTTAKTGTPSCKPRSLNPASMLSQANIYWPSTVETSVPAPTSTASLKRQPASRPSYASARILMGPAPATSPLFPSTTRIICTTWLGSKAIVAKSTNSAAENSPTFIYPIQPTAATPASIVTSSRKSASKARFSTNATTTAAISPITSSNISVVIPWAES